MKFKQPGEWLALSSSLLVAGLILASSDLASAKAAARGRRTLPVSPSGPKVSRLYRFAYDTDLIAGKAGLKQRKNDRRLAVQQSTSAPISAQFDDDDSNTDVYKLDHDETLDWRNGSANMRARSSRPVLVGNDVKVRSNLLIVSPEEPTQARPAREDALKVSLPASVILDLTGDDSRSENSLASDHDGSTLENTSQPRLITGRDSSPLVINSRGLITVAKRAPGVRLNTSSLLTSQVDHSLNPILDGRPSIESSEINRHNQIADRPAFLKRPPVVLGTIWRANGSSDSLSSLDNSSVDHEEQSATQKLKPQALNFDLYPSPASLVDNRNKTKLTISFHPNPPYRQPLELTSPAPEQELTTWAPTKRPSTRRPSSTSARPPNAPHRLGMSASGHNRPAPARPPVEPHHDAIYELTPNSTIAPQLNVLNTTTSSKPSKMINRLQHMLLSKIIKNQQAQASAPSVTTSSGTPAPLLSSTVANNVANLIAQRLHLFGRPGSSSTGLRFGFRGPVRPKQRHGPSPLLLDHAPRPDLNRRSTGVGSLLLSGVIYGLSMLPALMALTGVNPLADASKGTSVASRGGADRKLRRPLEAGSSIAYLVPLVATHSLEPDPLLHQVQHEAQSSALQALYAPPPTIIEPYLEPADELVGTPSRKHRDTSQMAARWSVLESANQSSFMPTRKPFDSRHPARLAGDNNMGNFLAWPNAASSSSFVSHNANLEPQSSSSFVSTLQPDKTFGKLAPSVTHYHSTMSSQSEPQSLRSLVKANEFAFAAFSPLAQQFGPSNQLPDRLELAALADQNHLERRKTTPLERFATGQQHLQDNFFILGPFDPPQLNKRPHWPPTHQGRSPFITSPFNSSANSDSYLSIMTPFLDQQSSPNHLAASEDHQKVTFAPSYYDPVFLPEEPPSRAREIARWQPVKAPKPTFRLESDDMRSTNASRRASKTAMRNSQHRSTTSTTEPPAVLGDGSEESELLLAHSMAMGTRLLNEPLEGDPHLQ